jgi:hypothetical protein
MKISKSCDTDMNECTLDFDFRFEEAITYFCVACEYNLRLSKQCTLPMRAMDSCLLFKARRLCFEVSNFHFPFFD